MKRNRFGLAIFFCILLIGGLCTGSVPLLGDKALIRGMILSQTQDGKTLVGLICMQPDSAADSSDATDKMIVVWGSGTSFSQAQSDAEKQLSGEADYKLCDILLINGIPSAAYVQNIADATAQNEKGRMAARIVCCENISEFRDEAADIGTLYSETEKNAKDSPRLYQVGGSYLLIPCVATDETAVIQKGAVCISKKGFCVLTPVQAEYAWLLQNGHRKFSQSIDGQMVILSAAVSFDTENSIDCIRVYGTVTGLNVPDKEKSEVRNRCTSLMRDSLRESWGLLSEIEADALHRTAFHQQKYGQAGQGASVQFQIRLLMF